MLTHIYCKFVVRVRQLANVLQVAIVTSCHSSLEGQIHRKMFNLALEEFPLYKLLGVSFDCGIGCVLKS